MLCMCQRRCTAQGGREKLFRAQAPKKKRLPSSPLLQPLATTLALDRAFQFLGVASFWAFSVVGCSLKETATLAWPCDLYRCTTHMPSNNIVPPSSPPPPPTPPLSFSFRRQKVFGWIRTKEICIQASLHLPSRQRSGIWAP